MVFMQLGILKDYWGDFSDNAWSVHVHYWTGTTWYLYLILQPYFATHGQMARHRTNGIIGMFIAGAVCLTALSMMHRDIVSAKMSAVEIVMMIAFGFAVIKSIIHRKQIENHSWWLISTVFIIMMPALGRGIQFALMSINPTTGIMPPLYLTQLLIIAMLLLGAWKYKKLTHPATYLALGINLFILLLEPIGRSESVQAFLKTMVKG
jgi:hypothetical protein